MKRGGGRAAQPTAKSSDAVESGFDSIELHLGHNYLLSSFLSPNLNRRTDDYGGSLENRLRLSRRVIGAVREVVGSGVAPGSGRPLPSSLLIARMVMSWSHTI